MHKNEGLLHMPCSKGGGALNTCMRKHRPVKQDCEGQLDTGERTGGCTRPLHTIERRKAALFMACPWVPLILMMLIIVFVKPKLRGIYSIDRNRDLLNFAAISEDTEIGNSVIPEPDGLFRRCKIAILSERIRNALGRKWRQIFHIANKHEKWNANTSCQNTFLNI